MTDYCADALRQRRSTSLGAQMRPIPNSQRRRLLQEEDRQCVGIGRGIAARAVVAPGGSEEPHAKHQPDAMRATKHGGTKASWFLRVKHPPSQRSPVGLHILAATAMVRSDVIPRLTTPLKFV
jgi:hypothetical protein